jgi:hypothetical protein
MNLISKNTTVSEQFIQRNQFVNMVQKWSGPDATYSRVDVDALLEASGVKCHYIGFGGVAGFEVVNEKQYVMFVLRWA